MYAIHQCLNDISRFVCGHSICQSKESIMTAQSIRARSLYRRILRELPSRSPSLLANPSPMQAHIRASFSEPTEASSPSLIHQRENKTPEHRLDEAVEFAAYLKAQRLYTTLLERYNPGMNMNEEERVRLTARRVGMNLPVEAVVPPSQGDDGGKSD